MFYTITFNPAIDLVMTFDNLTLGDLNRSAHEAYVIGGKGINVSTLLQNLGYDSIATGFIAGFTGNYIKETLEAQQIATHFVPVSGTTRVNVKLKGSQETELNAAGPQVDAQAMQALLSYFDERLTPEDTVFLAGNKAPGMSAADYVAVAQVCQQRGAQFVLDTTLDLLQSCLPYRPLLIKPNHHELGELFNVTISSEDDIIFYAKKLQEQGARHVLVSRGGDGALLVSESGDILRSDIPTGTVVNSVGAGDSMLAGFTAKLFDTQSLAEALQYGAACGSGTAFSIGIATKELVDSLRPQITVTTIEKG